MPTYDYRCEACGHEFEVFQGIKERKLRQCPQCGRRALVRLIGAGAGIIFKGPGFYVTDYKRKGSSDSAGAEKDKAESPKKESESSD